MRVCVSERKNLPAKCSSLIIFFQQKFVKTYLQLFPYEQFPFDAQFLQYSKVICEAVVVAGFVPNLAKTLGRLESALHFVGSTVIFLIVDFDILFTITIGLLLH